MPSGEPLRPARRRSWGISIARLRRATKTKERGITLRDWLELRYPKLVGLWDYPRYRLFSRCMACGGPMVLHSPWRLYICERTPLAIEITDKGRERVTACRWCSPDGTPNPRNHPDNQVEHERTEAGEALRSAI
jgi:hypothetical protein